MRDAQSRFYACRTCLDTGLATVFHLAHEDGRRCTVDSIDEALSARATGWYERIQPSTHACTHCQRGTDRALADHARAAAAQEKFDSKFKEGKGRQ